MHQTKLSPFMRKPAFCICKKQNTQISCTVPAQLFRAFVLATSIVHSVCFINLKFTAWFVSDLVRNRFSHDMAKIIPYDWSNLRSKLLHDKPKHWALPQAMTKIGLGIHMSRIMRKPPFCICEKQRRRSASR